MKTLKALLLLAVVLSVDHSVTADPIPDHSVTAAPSPDPSTAILADTIGNDSNPVTGLPQSIDQFGSMINCEAGKYWFNILHILNYIDYGCFCGPGGKGNPVDDLDRCCQVHDECYKAVKKNPECPDLLWEGDAPYLKSYNFSCDRKKKKATCYKEANDECQNFLCECDRATAECFATKPYNNDNWNLDQSLCE